MKEHFLFVSFVFFPLEQGIYLLMSLLLLWAAWIIMILAYLCPPIRLPADQRRGYKNVFNALIRIAREEGVPTLWRVRKRAGDLRRLGSDL